MSADWYHIKSFCKITLSIYCTLISQMESLKNRQDDGQKEEEEEEDKEKDEDEEEKKEKSLKGNRRKRKKKEQTDNRRSQEASDMVNIITQTFIKHTIKMSPVNLLSK